MNKVLSLALLVLSLLIFTISNAQKNSWAFNLGNGFDQQATDIAIDKSGNSIVVGLFKGANVDFDPSPLGDALLTSSGDNDVFVAKYNAAGQYIWAFKIGGFSNDAALDVALDDKDNIYVSGYFRGQSVDFDPSATTQALLNSNGEFGNENGFGGDAFLAKFTSGGKYEWAFNVGSSSILDYGTDVYVDKNGDILWTGSFAGSNVDFDPSSIVHSLSSQGVTEIFLAKYNTNGNYIWSSGFGGPTVVNSSGRAITVDNSGNIYLTGHFDGTIDLNAGPGINNFSSNGCGDFFLVKLNINAQYVLGFNVGGAECDYVWDIGIDLANNVYLTGYYGSANVDFNPGSGLNQMSSVGGFDAYVVKYDQNGNYSFSQSFGSGGEDIAYRILVQSDGYAIAGGFSGKIDFDSGPNEFNLTSSGGKDAFYARYDLNGNLQNGFRIGSTLNEAALGLASLDACNATYLAGYLQSTNVDFDPTSSSTILSSQGGNDIFMSQYVYGPTFLNNSQIVLDASECGNDGNISIIPLTGTAPFMYSIDGGATYVAGGNAGHTFQELAAGTYQLRLKDANGCESAVVTREVRPNIYPCNRTCTPTTFLNNSQIVLDASCNGGDGAIYIIPTSGTAPFMYSIDGGATYVSGPNAGYAFQNLSAGTYQLRLKDAKGCESAVVTREVKANAFGPCATIQAINPRLRAGATEAATIRAYPNPSRGQFQVQLQRFGAERVQVQVLDSRGSVLQTRTVNAQETNTIDINLAGKAKGLYLIRVVSQNQIQTQKITIQ